MRIIRASEVNTYLFCQRAWMYRLRGVEPANRQELLSGTEMHYAHGRMVVGSVILKGLAILLGLAALVWVLVAYVLPG